MVRFSIVETGFKSQDIKYLVNELRSKQLIAAVEKDVNNDTIYHTHNIVAVRKIADEYDGLMIEIVK